MNLISVIVPIYKVEEYLNRCINSIVNQSYKKLQIVLVDDGSPDNCGAICDEWEKKDNRIEVIHKENGGLSDARNAGMRVARGEYISFVDSDDWVEKNYLERLLFALESTNADIAECNTAVVTGFRGEKLTSKSITDMQMTTYLSEQALELLIEDKMLHQYVWNKLYRRSITENILFEVGKTNEDEFWTYQIFGESTKVVKIEDELYNYFQRSGSIMGQEYSLNRLDALDAKVQRHAYIQRHYPNLQEISMMNLYGTCIYSGQMVLAHLDNKIQTLAKEKIDAIRKIYTPSLRKILKYKKSRRIWLISSKVNFWRTCRLKNYLRKGI